MAATSTVQDNFNDNSRNVTLWPGAFSGLATYAEANNRLEITLANNKPGVNYAGYDTSTNTYNLTGSYVHVKLTTAPSGTNSQAILGVNKDANNSLFFATSGTSLLAQKKVSGSTTTLKSGTYNAATHVYLRIREASGTTYWDYSTNAIDWANFHSVANPLVITAVTVSLSGGTFAAQTNPGKAIWDNCNVVPVGNLADDFRDNSQDTVRWVAANSALEQNGHLELVISSGQTLFHSYTSAINYDLTGSAAQVRLTDKGNTALASYEVYPVRLIKDASNTLFWYLNGSTIYARKRVAGVTSTVASEAYSATNHQFLRIRESAGTVYFDKSADYLTWVNLGSVASPFAVISLQVEISAGTTSSEASGTTAKLNDFNVASLDPSAAVTVGDAEASEDGAITTQYPSAPSVSGDAEIAGLVQLSDSARIIDRKTFLYHVYDSNDNYLGSWNDVVSDFHYSQEINASGPSIEIELARTPDTLLPDVSDLTTEGSDPLTTESGTTLGSITVSPNQVGPGSTVDLTNRVDVFLFFGYLSALETQAGAIITTQDGATEIDAEVGSPNGRRIFTGYISRYKTRYGSPDSTLVTLNSFGDQLDDYIIHNGSDVNVPYYSQDPTDIFTQLLDDFAADGGVATYTSSSVDRTSTVVSYIYKLNTYLEGIKKVLELSPTDWHWFYNSAQNVVWLRGRPATAAHTFVQGKHLQRVDVEKYIDDLVNKVYFLGGTDIDGTTVFKVYEDSTSIAAYGQRLARLTDGRVQRSDSADILSQGELDRYKDPRYRTSVIIQDGTYIIEDIMLGDLVTFRGFDNFIDSLSLQVVGVDYMPDAITLQLDSLLPRINKRVEDIKRNLDNANTADVPSTPS